jgi:hypothetical protein
MGMMQTLARNEDQVIFTIFFVLIIVPPLFPTIFQSPVKVQWYTEAAFDQIDALEPGDTVLYCSDIVGENYATVIGILIDVLQHLFMKPDVKIVIWSFYKAESVLIFWDKIMPNVPQSENKEYGEEWVVFPFATGKEAGVATVMGDIRAIYIEDHYGTAIDDIPLMADINDYNDFAMVIATYPLGLWEVYAPLMNSLGRPCILLYQARVLATAMPYLNSGVLTGAVFDYHGAGEYETLMVENGYGIGSGQGTAAVGMMNTSLIYCCLLLVVGNIIHLRRRM